MKASQIRALANIADKPGANISAREGQSAFAKIESPSLGGAYLSVY